MDFSYMLVAIIFPIKTAYASASRLRAKMSCLPVSQLVAIKILFPADRLGTYRADVATILRGFDITECSC